MIIDHEWPAQFGHKIDWNNPRDINEKIQWLICYSDTSEWVQLADKWKVSEFLKKRGLGHILLNIYGVWDNASKIDFDVLPSKFVLKCNHDSGSTLIVDKSKGFEKEQIISFFNEKLEQKFGYKGCEPYYNKIKPMVLAEEFIENENETIGLVDYKIWCFNGRPYYIMTCHSRYKATVALDLYNLNWTYIPENMIFSQTHRNGGNSVPKPKNLKKMLEYASILSEGFPQVRVDFYLMNDRVYFGELTFSSYSGRMEYYTDEFLEKLGQLIELPKKRCPIKF
ncbi:ATP-grasp fold amidoligase family protein [Methanobrevibacter sp.]|uniref:ATP-grasp fold amidoligase family protein n=1 Tax=Methanobrevibacter sp. TaxID=66852 RepID=UPI00386CEBC7